MIDVVEHDDQFRKLCADVFVCVSVCVCGSDLMSNIKKNSLCNLLYL